MRRRGRSGPDPVVDSVRAFMAPVRVLVARVHEAAVVRGADGNPVASVTARRAEVATDGAPRFPGPALGAPDRRGRRPVPLRRLAPYGPGPAVRRRRVRLGGRREAPRDGAHRRRAAARPSRRRIPARPGSRPPPVPPRLGVVGPLARRRPRRRRRAPGHRAPLAGRPRGSPVGARRPGPARRAAARPPAHALPRVRVPLPPRSRGPASDLPGLPPRAGSCPAGASFEFPYDAELPPSARGRVLVPAWRISFVLEDPRDGRELASVAAVRSRCGEAGPTGVDEVAPLDVPAFLPADRGRERHGTQALPSLPAAAVPDVRGPGPHGGGLSRAPARRGHRPHRGGHPRAARPPRGAPPGDRRACRRRPAEGTSLRRAPPGRTAAPRPAVPSPGRGRHGLIRLRSVAKPDYTRPA